MKARQLVLLCIALLLPVVVFLFLKGFGKNEFSVAPLFSETVPPVPGECGNVTAPYAISDRERASMNIEIDSLACVSFNNDDFLSRVKEEFKADPLKFYVLDTTSNIKKCIFLLAEPFDIALVDSKGRIRGQYNSSEREEVDRLITEAAIIFKKY